MDSAAGECISVSLHSITFPDFCLHSAEMKCGAPSWVIREIVIRDGDREALGFDCRLIRRAQEALSVLTDGDIK